MPAQAHSITNRTLASLLPWLTRDATGWRMDYESITLRSVFQPVLSIAHQRIVGYEALLRASDAQGRAIAPHTLFASMRSTSAALTLERRALCVHFANFAEQDAKTDWLFINTLPRLFHADWLHRTFVDALCGHFDLPHERIVIEVLEQPAHNEALLARTLDSLRQHDFLIALDDFGVRLSNFDRVWQLRPDIVKLDRSLIARIANVSADRLFIAHLVTMLHRAGAMVLAEGVETEGELMALISADIDFIQGFWLGRPQASINPAATILTPSLWKRMREYEAFTGMAGSVFEDAVSAAARAAANGNLMQAAQYIFSTPEARRIFVIDEQGEQPEAAIAAPGVMGVAGIASATGLIQSEHLAPLPKLYCNWSRRAYFKRALASPGRVAIIGPHISPFDAKECYTAALAIPSTRYVFCVDFLPRELRQEP